VLENPCDRKGPCAGGGGGVGRGRALAGSPAVPDAGCTPPAAAQGVIAGCSSERRRPCGLPGRRRKRRGREGMRKWVRNVTGRCTPPTHNPPHPLWPIESASSSLGKRVICCCGSPALSVDGYQGIPRDVFPCDPMGRKT
jgi:hypothetical protein